MAAPDASFETWLALGPIPVRLLASGLGEADTERLSRGLAPFGCPPRPTDFSIELMAGAEGAIRFDVRRRYSPDRCGEASDLDTAWDRVLEGLAELIAAWRTAPLLVFTGEIWHGGGRSLWLGADPDDVAVAGAELRRRGLTRQAGPRLLWDLERRAFLALPGLDPHGAARIPGGAILHLSLRPALATIVSLEEREPGSSAPFVRRACLSNPRVATRAACAAVAERFAYWRVLAGNVGAAMEAVANTALVGSIEPVAVETSAPGWATNLRLAGLGVRLVCDPMSAAERADLTYVIGNLVVPDEPTPHLIYLQAREDGWRLASRYHGEAPEDLNAPTLRQLLPNLDLSLQAAVVHYDRSHLLMFGSAVWRAGEDLIWLGGEVHSGKTALALALIEHHGWALFADDFIAWDPKAERFVPIPKALRLRESAFELFPELGDRGLRTQSPTRRRANWLINPIADHQHAQPKPALRARLITCQFDPTLTETHQLTPIPAPDLGAHLLGLAHQCAQGIDDVAARGQIAERSSGFRLVFRDAKKAAECLAGLAARHPAE